jgi:hypothetical protein
MFVELNTGVYGLLSFILFFIYYGDKIMKNNLDDTKKVSALGWCMCSLSILCFISTNSKSMDSGVMIPQTVCMTYCLCFLTLSCSYYIINSGM